MDRRARTANIELAPGAADWQDRAACHRVGGNWFPYHPTNAARRLAALYCAHCPVFDECDAYAEATRSEGIWAGKLRPQPGRSEVVDLLRRTS